jgi:hypothetical protein
MINVQMVKGNVFPSRGRDWTETFSALDTAGNKPTNAIGVIYSMYWRTLGGKIYSSSAAIDNNEVTMVIPHSYMNPHATVVYLDLFWVCSDATVQKYAQFTVNVVDEADTGATVPEIISAPYPVWFLSAGLVTEGEQLGAMAWKVPGTGGTLKLLAAGAKTAAVGNRILLSLVENGIPSPTYFIELPEGETMVEKAVDIMAPPGMIYKWESTEVGSTYEGEDVYAWFMFYPTV